MQFNNPFQGMFNFDVPVQTAPVPRPMAMPQPTTFMPVTGAAGGGLANVPRLPVATGTPGGLPAVYQGGSAVLPKGNPFMSGLAGELAGMAKNGLLAFALQPTTLGDGTFPPEMRKQLMMDSVRQNKQSNPLFALAGMSMNANTPSNEVQQATQSATPYDWGQSALPQGHNPQFTDYTNMQMPTDNMATMYPDLGLTGLGVNVPMPNMNTAQAQHSARPQTTQNQQTSRSSHRPQQAQRGQQTAPTANYTLQPSISVTSLPNGQQQINLNQHTLMSSDPEYQRLYALRQAQVRNALAGTGITPEQALAHAQAGTTWRK